MDNRATAKKIQELRTILRQRGSENNLTLKQWRRIVRKNYGL